MDTINCAEGAGTVQEVAPVDGLPPEAVRVTSENRESILKGSFVYFLCLNGACIYVGQTAKLAQRMAGHRSNPAMAFDSVYYIRVPRQMRLEVEHEWISKIKPRLNKRTKLVRECTTHGNKEKFNFYMDSNSLGHLEAIRETTGLGVSELIRRAVDDYLERKDR